MSGKDPIYLDGINLTIEDVVKISRNKNQIEITEDARKKVRKARKVVDKWAEMGREGDKNTPKIYGLTTGVGNSCNKTFSGPEVDEFSMGYLFTHDCGVGKPFEKEVVRAIEVVNINRFLKGWSSVSEKYIDTLKEMLNKDVYINIPEQGSVGSSGDLAPLARLNLVMCGYGSAFDSDGRVISGEEALGRVGIPIYKIKAGEPLSGTNGPVVVDALAALNVFDAEEYLKRDLIVFSLTCEALATPRTAFCSEIQDCRPLYGQKKAAGIIRALIEDSKLIGSRSKVQDAYSMRTAPQIYSTTIENIGECSEAVEIEINSALDNPLVDSLNEKSLCGGNFQGQPIGQRMDQLKIGLTKLSAASERRIARLIDPNLSDLPEFLMENGNNGFMIAQYTAASLVNENKVLSTPSTIDTIPTSNNQEDVISFGTTASRYVRKVLENCFLVNAIEAMCATQAIDFRLRPEYSVGVIELKKKLKEEVATADSEVIEEYKREIELKKKSYQKPVLGKGTACAYEEFRRCVPFLDNENELAIYNGMSGYMARSLEAMKQVTAKVGKRIDLAIR